MNKNNNIIAIHNVYLSTYNDDVVNLKFYQFLFLCLRSMLDYFDTYSFSNLIISTTQTYVNMMFHSLRLLYL